MQSRGMNLDPNALMEYRPGQQRSLLFIRSNISPFSYQSLESQKLPLIPKASAFIGTFLLSRRVSVLQRT